YNERRRQILRVVMPAGDEDVDRVLGSLPVVVFRELLAQPGRLDADDIISFGAEVRGSPEDFSSNGIFLNFICPLGHRPLDDELQNLPQCLTLGESLALQDALERQ